jgi:hypothetical protein
MLPYCLRRPPDAYENWRVIPLAQVEYHGEPVTIAYNNFRVSLATEISQVGEACGATNNGILTIDNARHEDRSICRAADNCALPRSPSSPAAMITAARSRGVEDDFAVLMTGDDGKPVVVRVDEPNRLVVPSVTFYRGLAICEAARQRQKKEIENLK